MATRKVFVATTRTDYEAAKRAALGADTLAGHGLIAPNDAALAKDRAVL